MSARTLARLKAQRDLVYEQWQQSVRVIAGSVSSGSGSHSVTREGSQNLLEQLNALDREIERAEARKTGIRSASMIYRGIR